MRTRVYVDGFNLYYGALKGTAFKWLDLVSLKGTDQPLPLVPPLKGHVAVKYERPPL